MLYLYPSNKLEHLSKLLHSVMKLNAQHPLQKRVLLVQHTGMQHWLSMDLAKVAGISMQLDFPLPTRFIWETCRMILGDDEVPQQSSYKREVMVWRILEILSSPAFESSMYAESLKQFWDNVDPQQEHLQRFRFAQQLADLFEQYLVFRPDWLLAWDQDQNIDIDIDTADEFNQLCYEWQKWFWKRLIEESPVHPVVLQQRAMAKLSTHQTDLPEHIYLFAINTMPPGYMAFFNVLAEHTHIHWFHLNPCVDYWAEAKSDRAIARELRTNTLKQWVEEDNTHPLLRNFGKQGKDLLVQLLNSQYMEISAFDPPQVTQDNENYLLQQLQSDILKQADAPHLASHSFDAPTNIHVHACYHEIRELQVLKDFLLARLQHDAELGLDDILVMCPAIEEYSPFIGGIFETNDSQHLSISISDRQPIESQPVIAAFMQLLSLPEARFSVEQIMSLLDTPAVMAKFSLSLTDLKYCRAWIENFRISFALDSEQKASLVSEPNGSTSAISTKYTWEWGIERMLVATLISEEQQMANGVSIAHTIEGQSIGTLGKLIAFLSSLKHLVLELEQSRTIQQWREYFDVVLQGFFRASAQDEFALLLIEQALSALNENANLADFDDQVSIDIARQALKQGLTVPETKSRFMCGKITFCSMMPMRSIPFKVVAILGLNQKSFPRQSYPSELDLIAKSPARVGDRSRRNDDRYLFLEALISARSDLYLSYQYRNIQSNAVREPSLVLKELIETCHAHYSPNALQIVEHPLHPFSQDSFVQKQGWSGSFAWAWARHAKGLQKQQARALLKSEQLQSSQSNTSQLSKNRQLASRYRASQYEVNSNMHNISVNDLVAFYDQPLNYFAKECLQLRFELSELSEYSQPFDVESLQQYGFRQAIFNQLSRGPELDNLDKAIEHNTARFEQATLAGGDLPEWPDIENYIDRQKADIQMLVEFMQQECSLKPLSAKVSYEFNASEVAVLNPLKSAGHNAERSTIDFHCQIDAEHGMVFAVFKEKINLKDRLSAWMNYVLLMNFWSKNKAHPLLSGFSPEKPLCATMVSVRHPSEKSKQPKMTIEKLPILSSEKIQITFQHILQWFQAGTQRPLFANPKLLDDLNKFPDLQEALLAPAFRRKWDSQAQQSGQHLAYDALALNPYFHYFYGEIPPLNEDLLQIYFDVYMPMLVGEIEPQEGEA